MVAGLMNPDAAPIALLQEALANHKSGNLSTALLQYRVFLRREPENLSAWECYSILLLNLERFEDCMDACQRALAINPGSGLAKSNLNTALSELMIAGVKEKSPEKFLRFTEQQARLQNSGSPHAEQWDVGIGKLLLGDFEAGWRLYESRLRFIEWIGQRDLLDFPRWDGGPFHGKTLLLHGEQGFGDMMMMFRYLKQIKPLGGTLLVLVPPSLAGIASTCDGPDAVIVGGEKIQFSMQLPMMSLPLVFNTRLDTIPSNIPYISVPDYVPNKARIISRLNEAAHTKKYGLVWAGRPTHVRDSERSVPPGLLRPLEALEGLSWFCLQHDAPGVTPFPGAVPLGDLFETFSDTAFALSQLDLVVTVDTSVAHLAGAMGVPVCLLVTFLPDFRWLLWRSDSPWYPSIKIYRQPDPGDWPAVVQQVAADLAKA